MSVYESSITNPKKQLEFYKDLSEQLQQENKQLKEVIEEARKKIEAILDGQFSLEPDYTPDFFLVDTLEEIDEILYKAEEK